MRATLLLENKQIMKASRISLQLCYFQNKTFTSVRLYVFVARCSIIETLRDICGVFVTRLSITQLMGGSVVNNDRRRNKVVARMNAVLYWKQ